MARAAAVRRIAAAAVYGGGGLTALGASLYGVLRAEAKFARHTIGEADGRVRDATGWYGRGRPGPALRLALLGDSSAAGYGVRTVEETPGAWLGSGVAERADRRVHLREYAKVGAQSSGLDNQVTAALSASPDVAIIYIGANDVTHAVLPSASVRHLSAAVRRLTEAGTAVVVGTCPDLGTIQPLPPPLRQVARIWSRQLAAAQTIAVVEAGGRTVSLASILGEEFAAAPALLFGPDRFHPSARGYESMARVMVPSVLAALGLGETEEDAPRAGRGEAVLPIGYAAAKASESPGTEIDGTEVGGATRGVGGRWVTLMRRRLLPTGTAQTPDGAEGAPEDAGAPAEDSAGAPG
ncbi:GDSL family lipase [Marmoricola sp. Leaf446]|uniref:SGNH/GDSL hydrolase family protein n=1 Tax=Marmoricola sp. Leaf446 TaxID=1736379 RepID=UPI0006FA5854|nr:SGNH/GDSL hydrolase family protein [Marmoricola sp. Leaf446]KQT93824.1 GDSL family lipase [Marmoricola sp. Leaf446]